MFEKKTHSCIAFILSDTLLREHKKKHTLCLQPKPQNSNDRKKNNEYLSGIFRYSRLSYW